MEYLIASPVDKVWQALVDPKIIEKWGGGPAMMAGKVDFEFELWGGEIYGKNIEVSKNKKLVQGWRQKGLKESTKVTFSLTPKEGLTSLVLLHEQVPDKEFEDLEKGWREYYLGPIKILLEK